MNKIINKQSKLFIVLALFLVINISFANAKTDISIKVMESKVANLLYELETNEGKKIEDGIKFELKGTNGKIYYSYSKDSKLIFEKIPFGEYTIKPLEKYYGTMKVNANSEYLKKQHLFKKYILSLDKSKALKQIDNGDGTVSIIKDSENSNDKVQTGDIFPKLALIFSSMSLFVILMFIKRKES